MAKRSRKRSVFMRWLAVGALALMAFLYYRPLHSYFSTRAALAQQSAEVRKLATEHELLLHRLAQSTSTDTLEREARRLGLVKPGEQLFIVKGIAGWLRKQGSHAVSSTIGANG
jgi:cell division protein FtsB